MTDLREAVSAAIEAGDADACLAAICGASEADRRGLAGFALERVAAVPEEPRIIVPGDDAAAREARHQRWKAHAAQVEAARVLLFATRTAAQLRKLRWRDFPSNARQAEIVCRLRPAWAEAWMEVSLAAGPRGWDMLRRVVKEGACAKPDHENYTLAMVAAFSDSWKGEQPGVYPRLLEDPDLLQDEVWRLFEVEGGGDTSLANCDRWSSASDYSWTTALVRLAEEGRLDRARLLDASLETLGRDFGAYRARWYAQFHEALAPSLEERGARAETYARLLGSAVPSTVTLALKAAGTLQKAKRLEGALVIAHVAPALLARAKKTALAALKLLGKALDPADPGPALAVAVEALGHERQEVQVLAFDLLEAHGEQSDLALQARIEQVAPLVAPSVRSRLEGWGVNAVNGLEQEEEAAPGFAPTSTIDASRAIEPLRSLDATIEGCAYVLENPGDMEALEQSLAGVSRFCGERPSDFRTQTSALLKRARKFAPADHERPVRFQVASLLVAWLSGGYEPWPVTRSFPDFEGFLAGRLQAIARRAAAGEARPLLSAPTHRRSWVAPTALVERLLWWQRTANEPDPHDLSLALARLAPDGRGAAQAAAKELTGEVGRAVRFALGAGSARGARDAALWSAAARARAPYADVSALKPLLSGPGADAAGVYTWQATAKKVAVTVTPALPKGIKPLPLTVLAHRPRHTQWEYRRSVPIVQWAATTTPAYLEAFFADGVRGIGWNLDWWEADWTLHAFLEPLLDPDVDLRPMATLLIAVALGAKEPGLRGLATDAVIAGLEERRLDPQAIGGAMATLMGAGLVKPARWSKALDDAARVSSMVRQGVLAILACTLQGDPGAAPRDVGKLLQVYHELLIASGGRVEAAATVAYLEGIGGGKAGKLSKALRAL